MVRKQLLFLGTGGWKSLYNCTNRQPAAGSPLGFDSLEATGRLNGVESWRHYSSVNLSEGKRDMRSVFLAFRWTAAAWAIALFAVVGDTRGDDEPHSKNKGSGSARSNSGGGRRPNADGGGKSGEGARSRSSEGKKTDAGGGVKRGTGGRVDNGGGRRPNVDGAGKSDAGGSVKRGTGGGGKPDPSSRSRGEGGGKPHAGGGGNVNHKGPSKTGWNSWTKNGWNKDGWNSSFNSQHHHHHHGYWNNGIWIAPWVIAYNQPWVYLQPTQRIVSGQKWLGVTFAPYDGGGAYITGIYEGSPAQAVGLEVGDVIVAVDGVDATDLGNVLQASGGNVVLQVLSGRTGELVQSRVNLIR
jgi:hypothetical protein